MRNFLNSAKIFTLVGVACLVCACAPQREFVRFGNPGTFHPGPPRSAAQFSGPDGEYDSYELIDHGTAPNHGVPAMYSGQQGGYPMGW
jgi:hypothetical protein